MRRTAWVLTVALAGCGSDSTDAATSDTGAESDGSGTAATSDGDSGDGDGGDGDGTSDDGDGTTGDGDGTTSGDGDGATGDGTTLGDGDGDATSGDGDGDGDGDGATSGDGATGDGDGTTSGDGDGTTSGDGDGTTSGDGDGTTGDGDGTTGDGDGTTGDGDGTTGDGDGDGSSGDGDGDGTFPSCLPPGYATYFEQNPAVATATLGRQTAAEIDQFCADLVELEATRIVTLDEPGASVFCVEPASCLYINLTPTEVSRIMVAKHAHAVWVDHNGLVPWALSGYAPERLEELFDPARLFRNGNQFMSVVDYSPSDAWAYVEERGLIGLSEDETIVAVLGDLRSTDADIDFLHGIAGLGDPTNTAYTLDDALRTWVDRGGGTLARISRAGCHSMSRIVIALTRVMNIPSAEQHDGQWFGVGHSTPAWPLLDAAVPHGDNLYGATLRITPTPNLLAMSNFYLDPTNTSVCGTDTACLGRRFGDLASIAYPANYMVQRCCNPTNYGYNSCTEYMTNDYSLTLSPTELSDAITSVTALCP